MSSSCDITIIMAPFWQVWWPWTAPAYLCEALRKKGYNVQYLDFNVRLYHVCRELGYEYLWEDMAFGAWTCGQLNYLIGLLNLDEIQGGVIGLSTVQGNRTFSVALAKRLRQRFPNRKIIFGGHAVHSEHDVTLIPNTCADAICKGEGEETICEVLASGFEHLEGIDGLYLPAENGWRPTPDRPVQMDLNAIAFPTYEEIDFSRYSMRFMPIMASRGCTGRCIFCSDRFTGQCFRTRSAERQMEEIHYLVSHFPIEYFPYHDSLMNGDMDILSQKTELLLQSGLDIRFGGNMMVRMDVSPDFFQALRRSGMTTGLIGIESGSRKVLRDMRKKHRPDMAATFLRDMHAAGIRTEVNFMVGFPTETEQDFQDTLAWIRDNSANIDVILSATTFCLVPSELMDQYGAFQIVFDGLETFHDWHTRDGANTRAIRHDRLQRLLAMCRELGLIGGTGIISDEHTIAEKAIPDEAMFMARHASFVEELKKVSPEKAEEAQARLDAFAAACRAPEIEPVAAPEIRMDRLLGWANGRTPAPWEIALSAFVHDTVDTGTAGPYAISDRRLLRLVDEAADLGVKSWAVSVAGEPIWRDELIMELCRRVKVREMHGSLHLRDAGLSHEQLELLVRIEWDEIVFDVTVLGDSAATAGLAGRAREMRETLADLCRCHGAKGPAIAADMLITRDNYAHLGHFVPLGQAIGAARIGTTIPEMRTFFLGSSGLSNEAFRSFIQDIERAIAEANCAGIPHDFDVLLDAMQAFSGGFHDSRIHRLFSRGHMGGAACFSPWSTLAVALETGNIGPCAGCAACVSPEWEALTLREIWLGDDMNTVRRRLVDDWKLPEACLQCDARTLMQDKRLREGRLSVLFPRHEMDVLNVVRYANTRALDLVRQRGLSGTVNRLREWLTFRSRRV